MSLARAVGSTVAGALATVLASASTLVALPFLGLATAKVVGTWVPAWAFLLPLGLCAALGGSITGALQVEGRARSAALGGLSAGVGTAVVGVLAGLVVLVVLLGMTPAHGQTTDLSRAALRAGSVGGGVAFVGGVAFGAVGGLCGHGLRRRVFGEADGGRE